MNKRYIQSNHDKQWVAKRAKCIRLIVLDMDGTCMNSQGKVSLYTSHVIQTLVDRGYLVVPATGRGFYGLREEILRVVGIRYVISANGAVVTNGKEGWRLWERLIPRQTAERFVEDMLREDCCIYYHRNDKESSHLAGCLNQEVYEKFASFLRCDWPRERIFLGSKLRDYIERDGKDVVKLGLVFTAGRKFEDYEPFIRENYPQLNCFRVSDRSLELTNILASKGNALRFLCEYLEIEPEQVCAVGDQENDISMLHYAGVGVAMGNAVSPLIEQADYVAGTNDKDGAARFLEEFFL